jgi:hypothetical protein
MGGGRRQNDMSQPEVIQKIKQELRTAGAACTCNKNDVALAHIKKIREMYFKYSVRLNEYPVLHRTFLWIEEQIKITELKENVEETLQREDEKGTITLLNAIAATMKAQNKIDETYLQEKLSATAVIACRNAIKGGLKRAKKVPHFRPEVLDETLDYIVSARRYASRIKDNPQIIAEIDEAEKTIRTEVLEQLRVQKINLKHKNRVHGRYVESPLQNDPRNAKKHKTAPA